MLIGVEDDGIALALGEEDGHDLRLEAAVVDGRQSLALALQGEGVLLLAADDTAADAAIATHLIDVLGRLAHRLQRKQSFHLGVGVAPAEGGVPGGHVARRAEGAAVLGQGVGGAGHALHATGDVDVALAGGDGPRRLVDGVQAAGAQPVDRDPADGVGQPGQQRGHAGHVAVVLAGLVGAAEKHFLHLGRVDARPVDDLANDQRGQIVGPRVRKRAGVAADGRAHAVDNYDVLHVKPHMENELERPAATAFQVQALTVPSDGIVAQRAPLGHRATKKPPCEPEPAGGPNSSTRGSPRSANS
ncbi:protein of unknown function [Candidatus Promineifilum breve]|uniref:Uncharacterized protein n=1 Tax=Candidatus Promineifilum breve TaxID=1806508 RepID=A0A160SYS9_9CHLR|nr:protein of unknown function [Candidatus Promineifilum breve]